MSNGTKITTGANDRPRDETISQTGSGLPDDSGRPVSAPESEVKRVRDALQASHPEGTGRSGTSGKPVGDAGGSGNPEAVPPDSPGAGENICRTCGGSGKIDGETCPDCGGTGKITEPLGGA